MVTTFDICPRCNKYREMYVSKGLCRICVSSINATKKKYVLTEEQKEKRNRRFKLWYNRDKHSQFERIYANKRSNKVKGRGRQNVSNHREEILILKGNVCELCGSNMFLEVHHLDYSWDKIKGESGLKLNLDKLKLLCKSCHYKVHRKI